MRPYLRLLHCTCALLLLAPALADAQQKPAPRAAYTTFVRGTPIGREDVTVQSDASGLTVTSEGRLGAPVNLIIRRAEFRYAANGSPQLFELQGDSNGADISIKTTVAGGNVTNARPDSARLRPPGLHRGWDQCAGGGTCSDGRRIANGSVIFAVDLP